ncbi:MAG: YtxH domain-containing protein [Acidobacteria bacterium]|nr:MAG: YtxH domain-containing protein [Acidobacteriota bacterium]
MTTRIIAVLALLYAPRSGQETRELLSEKLRETAERGREAREQLLSRGRELLDEAGGYVERQKAAVEERKERFAAAVEAGRQAYREEKAKEKV